MSPRLAPTNVVSLVLISLFVSGCANPAPPTPRLSPTPDQCPKQSALDWLNQVDTIVSQFVVDGTKATSMLADVSAPIDAVEMTGIYQRNVARENVLASIKPPPCLQDAHDKLRAAFSDYSAMYKAMSNDELDTALSDFHRAKSEWEDTSQLLQQFSNEQNIPLPSTLR